MKSILGIGNAITDIVVPLKENSILKELGLAEGSMTHIDRGEREKILQMLGNLQTESIPGGSAANTVVATARLGMKSGFVGMVGDDSIGRSYTQNMEGNGVAAHLLKGTQPSGTSMAFITMPDGERTFATYLGAALELAPVHIKEDIFGGYDFLHVEGYLIQCPQVVEHILKIAKLRGMTVSLDLGSFNIVEKNLHLLTTLVERYVDIVFANDAEAKAFTGNEAHQAASEISSMGAGKVAVVKLGGEGSIISKGKQVCTIEAMDVPVVDTTGAGDAFAAGFLYAYSGGADLYKSGICGTILAAGAIGELGPKIGKNGWEVAKKAIAETLKAKD